MYLSFLFLALSAVTISSVPLNDLRYPFLDGKIVGGEPVDIKDFPYQVSFQYKSRHYCGGSIVSKNIIITAAHCIKKGVPSTIRAGSSLSKSGGQVVKVKESITHPQYKLPDYDIAVLILESELTLGEGVQPIPLPEENEEVPDDSEAVVSGWGATSEGSAQLPDHLQAVKVNIINHTACQEMYFLGGAKVTDRMICAGVLEGGKDSCQGDSGGPLVVNGKLIGVVSWGAGCARPKYPGVYASVPNLRKFIQEAGGV